MDNKKKVRVEIDDEMIEILEDLKKRINNFAYDCLNDLSYTKLLKVLTKKIKTQIATNKLFLN